MKKLYCIKLLITILMLLIAMLSLSAVPASAAPLKFKNIHYGSAMNAAAASPDRAVMVGEDGYIATSDDGISWTIRDSGTVSELRDIVYANGQFIAVGVDGTILSSADGISWNREESGTTHPIDGVGYGDGKYLAVGYGGMILMSDDGHKWRTIESGTDKELVSVCYGNGKYVAVGESGLIMTSIDGITWETKESEGWGLGHVAFGSAGFVAVGEWGTILTSADGEKWVERKAPPGNMLLRSVVYTDKEYIVVGNNFSSRNIPAAIYVSTDGIRWVSRKSSVNENLHGALLFKGRYIAFGDAHYIISSGDTVSWKLDVEVGTSMRLNGVCYGANGFVAVGYSGIILSSPDGIKWQKEKSTVDTLYSVVYGDGKYVAVGDNVIAISYDGKTWKQTGTGKYGSLYKIIDANGKFTAISQSAGIVISSVDGLKWDKYDTGAGIAPINGIAYSNGEYRIVGGYATTISSTDGSNWKILNRSESGVVAYTSTLYFDGRWHDYEREMIFAGGLFVQSDDDHNLLLSADGTNWDTVSSGTSQPISCYAYGNGRYVAVGENGVIVVSE